MECFDECASDDSIRIHSAPHKNQLSAILTAQRLYGQDLSVYISCLRRSCAGDPKHYYYSAIVNIPVMTVESDIFVDACVLIHII